jgi:hypothetical protein
VRGRSTKALALVCAVHAVAPLVLVGPRFWYEWDETVNISQVSRHAPPGAFTAPRARGVPWLVAPVTQLTYSTAALRIYLAIVSSLLLYLAFRPWLRLRPGFLAPLAAGLFTTIWSAVYYGFEAMPNEFVAIGAVAAVGHFLLAARDRGARDLWWLGGWLTFVALMRPSDAVYLGAPLVVAAFLVHGVSPARRGLLAGCTVGGVALGWVQWVVEAYTSYGGLAARLRAASAENHGGIHWALGLEARALAGPTLCRPCARSMHWPPVGWWFLIPPLVALGIWAGRRHLAVALLPAAAGLTLLAQYAVTIDYAAPRFLLPTYALLAIPVAEGVGLLATAHYGRWWRPAVAVPVLCAVGLAHLAIQLGILERAIVPRQTAGRLQYLAVGRDLNRHGIRPPCLVVGYFAPPIAFAAGCADEPSMNHPQRLRVTSGDGRTDVAVLSLRPAPASAFYASWPHHRAVGRHLHHPWYVYERRQ